MAFEMAYESSSKCVSLTSLLSLKPRLASTFLENNLASAVVFPAQQEPAGSTAMAFFLAKQSLYCAQSDGESLSPLSHEDAFNILPG